MMMTMIEKASKKVIEQRSCVGCRTVRHKSELIRCVKSPSGEVTIDRDGKAQGRGAYLCKNLECFAKVKKKRLFNRAFKTTVDDKLYDELEQMIAAVR
ncbi:MAG: YlxR family protein [Selenomonadaceae bacterium]|nr:YlxR family protein [Selenomonadaceae bacterium]